MISDHLEPLVLSAYATGIVVSVWRDGERENMALRNQRVAGGDPLPDGAGSLFETGSVGKVFTGLLLAEGGRRGEVCEDTPVGAGWGIEPFSDDEGVQPVLLWHLSAHVSGLPRSPENLHGGDANPYKGYTREDMREALSAAALATRPGTSYEYSNLALGLLGAELSDAAGMAYAHLLHDRAFPLMGIDGRAWTALDCAAHARLAPGHAFGVPAALWGAEDALAPSGCVVTSAGALLDAVLAFRDAPEGSSLHDTLRVRFPFPEGGGVALGWHVLDDGTRWHNGSTGGYHAFVAFHPEHDVAIAVLANDVAPEVTEASFRLFDALLGRAAEPLVCEPWVEWPAERCASIAGRFVDSDSGIGLELRMENACVMARLDGQAFYRVFPMSDDTLRYRVVGARLVCAFDRGGQCTALELHQGGAVTRFDRAE